MKKIFSTVAMAIAAFTAVVSMSSCQNDSPSSFNAAPQVPTTTNTKAQAKSNYEYNYEYQATVANDMFDLYDITITRTVGSDVKTVAFTDNAQLEKHNAKQTVKDSFKSSENVFFKADVKLKANWKEIVAAKGADYKPVFGVMLKCTYKNSDRNQNPVPATINDLSEESLTLLAKCLANKLTI